MSIRKIMSSPPVTVELDDSISVVNDIFKNTRFHHLLVVENDELYGVVSDRDLLKALSPNIGTAAEKPADLATLNKRVHQIMSRKPIIMKEEESIHKAIEIFDDNPISCIPVVDNNNKPIGILSWRDLIRAIRERTQ